MADTVRILVVDDSEIFTDLLGRAIEAEPRAELVGVARNGREAIEMTRRLRPDVISMDVFMPVMDGLDAVEHIMDEVPTPIVMVTAAGSEEMTHISFRAVGSGALDVLEKPAGPVDARAIVTRLHSYELYAWAPEVNWDHVDKVILVSQAMKGKFDDLYPAHAHKTEVVYSASSIEKFKPIVETESEEVSAPKSEPAPGKTSSPTNAFENKEHGSAPDQSQVGQNPHPPGNEDASAPGLPPWEERQ